MTDTSVTFPALGTSVFVAARDPGDLPRAQRLAADVLRDVDEVCSRFRADSDLSRVNTHPGTWVQVDPLLVAAVEVAVQAARATEGLVHPLLGRQLVRLGYDRDFAMLVELPELVELPALVDLPGGEVTESEPPALADWTRIGLDPHGAIKIPSGASLDLGATGKAWAADLIAAAFQEHLAAAAIVSVGGDLRIARPDCDPWPVAIAERPGAVPDALVALDRGGLATSSTQVRRWTHAGVRQHHLLDPRTGRRARQVWRTVTATGPTCSAANTASTAAIVLGEEAPDWLVSHGVTARLVAADGAVRTVGHWPAERSAA